MAQTGKLPFSEIFTNQEICQPLGISFGLFNRLGVAVGWKLQCFAVINHFMRLLSVAAAPATTRFGFNQEHAARADGHMVNVPIIPAGQVVKHAETFGFIQCFRHGLLAAQIGRNGGGVARND